VEILRSATDFIRQNVKSAAVIVGSYGGYVVATVTDDLIKHNIKANEIIEQIKPLIDGNGGGRPQMAQAGTKDPSKIEGAIKKIRENLEKAITSL
jgi:alanyl-tRNA synthetase